MSDGGYNDSWASLVATVAVLKKARARLAGTNVMGQKLDKPLVDEIDGVLAIAKRALDEQAEKAMKDAQLREAVRSYRGPLRRA